MATIRKKGRGWQAAIRREDGHPPVYKSGFIKQEAKDWATEEEARRRQESYSPLQLAKKYPLAQAIAEYIEQFL